MRRASFNVATTMLTAPRTLVCRNGATGGNRLRPGQRRASRSARAAT